MPYGMWIALTLIVNYQPVYLKALKRLHKRSLKNNLKDLFNFIKKTNIP